MNATILKTHLKMWRVCFERHGIGFKIVNYKPGLPKSEQSRKVTVNEWVHCCAKCPAAVLVVAFSCMLNDMGSVKQQAAGFCCLR